MKEVKTHTFNGRKYRIYIDKLKGCTTVSKNTALELMVRTDGVSERQLFDTLIHEALHACGWSASEKKVKRTANDISNFLWRLGYRRKI